MTTQEWVNKSFGFGVEIVLTFATTRRKPVHTILFKICDTWRRPAFWTFIVGPALMFYGLMTCLSGTMRLEHCLLIGAMLTMNYVPKCRPFFQMTFPFFLGGILYDLL